MRRVLMSAAVLLLALAGPSLAKEKKKNELPAEVQQVLLEAKTFELISLDPSRIPPKKDEPAGSRFHNFRILGSTIVKDKADRKKLLAALNKGIAENPGIVAGCFNPRHGIRATHDKTKVELVICFECFSISVYVDEKRSSVLVTKSPKPAFDKVLKAAKVPLPKK